MKLAVMGSSGYEAIAASPASGAEIMTGEEPAEALAGAQVVADVENSASVPNAAYSRLGRYVP
jgi:hypothetical protein